MAVDTNRNGPLGAGSRIDQQSGFTLVELLIAITLLGFIMAMATGSVRTGIRVWESADRSTDEVNQIQAVQHLIRRQLGRAFPVQQKRRGVNRAVLFEGTRDSIRFVSPMPPHLGTKGLYQIAIEPAYDRNGTYRLNFQRALFQVEDDFREKPENAKDTLLLEGIRSVEFAYFGRERDRLSPRWRSQWHDVPLPPMLVRIRVHFEDGDTRSWPELVVAVHNQHPADRR